MDNHYHVVIETAEPNLSKGMRQLNGVYTQYFNRRHGRVGHVFQGRFKGILVEKDSYLLELARYVVLNPVRAGMVRSADRYPWSSYSATAGDEASPEWLEVRWILSQFYKQRKRAIARYKDFVQEGRDLPPIWGNLRNQIFLGGPEFVDEMLEELTKKENLDEVPLLQRRAQPKSLSHYKKVSETEDEAIAAAYATGGYTQKELGKFFGKHYSTISRIVKQQEMQHGKT